ncbi:MAG: methyl-accepting chemotaxis protein [Candidatus Wallbacteria bacterium]|nr:methyl-accepting chemotaxis protein [Candidatus Wallbacteria bacterium]
MNTRQISLKAKLTYAFSLIPLMILILAVACFLILNKNTSEMGMELRLQLDEMLKGRASLQSGFLKQALEDQLSLLGARLEAAIQEPPLKALVSGGDAVGPTPGRTSATLERSPGATGSESVLGDALKKMGASFLTIVDASGRTLYRATNPGRTGDELLAKDGGEGAADLKSLFEKAAKGGLVTSVEVLPATVLREELVTDATSVPGAAAAGDSLADVARTGDEGRGLTLLAACAIPGGDGRTAAVAFAGLLVNRNSRLLAKLQEAVAGGGFVALTVQGTRVLSSEPGRDGKSAAGVSLDKDFWSQLQQDPNKLGEFETGLGAAFLKSAPLKDHRDRLLGCMLSGVSADLSSKILNQIDAAGEVARAKTRSVIMQIGLIILVLTLVVGYTLSIRITGPIQYLIDVSRAITAGDYGRRAQIDSGDEFGALAAAFNVMAATINDKIQKAESLIRQITDSIARLSNSTGEISSIVQRQVSGATEQAASVNEVTTTSEEIAATARQIADNAASVKDIANEATRACGKGTDDTTTAIQGMRALKDHVQSIAESMLVLGKNSQKIGEVINIIDEISKQTNLLSLNAAIEAAGAGEEGKRFAVVAVEVKRLADRTVDATKQIKQLIDMIQNSTNKTILLTEEGSKSVDAGFEMVEQVGKSLENIVTLVKKTARAANEISLSTGQQTTATDNMAQSISDVSRVAGQVLKSSEDTRKAVADINDLADQLRKLVSEDDTPRAS